MSYNHCATARGPEEHLRDGESCQICKDWMKQVGAKIVNGKVIAPKPKVAPITTKQPKPKRAQRERKPASLELQPCGTPAAADRHRKKGEPICDPCKEAKRIESRDRRARIKAERESKPLKPAQIRSQCGSRAGANYHRDHGEQKCTECVEAERAYNRAGYHRNKGPAKPMGRKPDPREHGTHKGFWQHKRTKEPMCEPCRLAFNAYERERHRQRQIKKIQEATRGI